MLVLICFFHSQAQQVTIRRSKIKLDENTIMQDSTGQRLAYNEWHPLITNGEYGFKRVHPEDSTSTLILFKLSNKQKLLRESMIPKPAESPYFNTGGKVEMFHDKAIDGYAVNTKALAGKIVVLNFWFIDCQPCRTEIPELNKMVADYKDNLDVVFIAVTTDNKSDIQKFIETTPFSYHLVANSQDWTSAWGIRTFPTNVIIDRDGIIRFHTSGYGPVTTFWIRKTIDSIK